MIDNDDHISTEQNKKGQKITKWEQERSNSTGIKVSEEVGWHDIKFTMFKTEVELEYMRNYQEQIFILLENKTRNISDTLGTGVVTQNAFILIK